MRRFSFWFGQCYKNHPKLVFVFVFSFFVSIPAVAAYGCFAVMSLSTGGRVSDLFDVSSSLEGDFEFVGDDFGSWFGVSVRDETYLDRWVGSPGVNVYSSVSNDDRFMVDSVENSVTAAGVMLSVGVRERYIAQSFFLGNVGSVDVIPEERHSWLFDAVRASTLRFFVPGEVSGFVNTGNLSGPSAGLMMTLALLDASSPGDLSAGLMVAGTGSVSADLSVGSVGSVNTKFVAVSFHNADVFFIPSGNAVEFRYSAIPEHVSVINVSSVEEAVRFLCDSGATDDVCS